MRVLVERNLGKRRNEYFKGKEKFEVIGNDQNLNSVNGAGIQSAQNVVNLKVNAVITGNCGPKAFMILKANDLGFAYEACLLSAMLSEKDIFKNMSFNCDIYSRFLHLYE
ncbi:MAG: hypothetical protein EOM73_17795, partial [Bacteroidia bacterium]|nr:hypothetical protein [Bacteroidia bacterium]